MYESETRERERGRAGEKSDCSLKNLVEIQFTFTWPLCICASVTRTDCGIP